MFSDNKKPKETLDYSKNQNKISEGTLITGDLVSKGGFRIEGKIEGNVKTEGRIVVGATGSIIGTLTCESAEFEGSFSGNLDVSDTLTLKPTAKIEGEVVIGKLVVESGASFNVTSCAMKGAVKPISKKQNGGKSA